ncbi:MAG: hypothetical protein OES38_08720 [Gammaproteobacteria bacterium]|nr:hypothetical protein [Gammaproteobacteria bacterium]
MQTIKDINSSFTLYAVCVGCARMEPLSAERLKEELGPDTLLEDVRKRLRCQRCGERSGDIRIVYVGPCRSAAGFHYRR